MLINIFLIGIVAAVTEELFFRGLVQGIFHRWTGQSTCRYLDSCLSFSFYTCSSTASSPVLLGALLGYICYWSGSLWTAMAGHFINNTAAVILYFLVSNGSVEQDPTETGTWVQALVFLPVLPYLYGNSAAMEQDWMMVYNTADRQQAWIVRSALEEQADIRVVAVDKTSSPMALPCRVKWSCMYIPVRQRKPLN